MLNIDEKVFMNIQEAVGWLLANNALPFQSTANYVANTEIAKTTIINPSPAKIKVGALVLFADSKVGTVSGLTSNGFMVGSEYTDIQTALAYISGVSVNASGYLTVTLSDGTIINAGQIKAISSFFIDGSQHLIANFNNGTTQDLGAIFQGNVNIVGTLNATKVTGDEILEKDVSAIMAFETVANVTLTSVYGGAVKNGNKLTFVFAFKLNRSGVPDINNVINVTIPASLGSKLYVAYGSLTLARTNVYCVETGSGNDISIPFSLLKFSNEQLKLASSSLTDLVLNNDYYIRCEFTFLLSDNLLS